MCPFFLQKFDFLIYLFILFDFFLMPKTPSILFANVLVPHLLENCALATFAGAWKWMVWKWCVQIHSMINIFFFFAVFAHNFFLCSSLPFSTPFSLPERINYPPSNSSLMMRKFMDCSLRNWSSIRRFCFFWSFWFLEVQWPIFMFVCCRQKFAAFLFSLQK